jgi:Cdc6-like AAA superfamily ATPase
MEKKISISDVFTPTRFPTYSYVTRHANYESSLQLCIESGFIAFIHGPTKSGKTVLAERVAREIEYSTHKISARNFTSTNDFWETIASQLGIQDSITETKSAGKSEKKSISWFAKITAWFAAEASFGGAIEKGQDTSVDVSKTYTVDPITVLKRKEKRKLLVIVDNFHYIQNQRIQKELLQELRNLLDYVSLIIIAITDKPDYLNMIEGELVGRNRAITIGEWTNQELMDIAQKGFKRLNIELSPLVLQELNRECMSAPAIMQAICLYLGLFLGHKTMSDKAITISQNEIGSFLNKACGEASRLFDNTQVYNTLINMTNKLVGDMARVRIRTQSSRNLSDDPAVSIPEAVLQAFASQSGLVMTLPELKNIYNKVIIVRHQNQNIDFDKILEAMHQSSEAIWREQIQQQHLDHVEDVQKANIDIEISLLIYDKVKELISIQDPYFAFFTRWSGHIRGINL